MRFTDKGNGLKERKPPLMGVVPDGDNTREQQILEV